MKKSLHIVRSGTRLFASRYSSCKSLSKTCAKPSDTFPFTDPFGYARERSIKKYSNYKALVFKFPITFHYLIKDFLVPFKEKLLFKEILPGKIFLSVEITGPIMIKVQPELINKIVHKQPKSILQ